MAENWREAAYKSLASTFRDGELPDRKEISSFSVRDLKLFITFHGGDTLGLGPEKGDLRARAVELRNASWGRAVLRSLNREPKDPAYPLGRDYGRVPAPITGCKYEKLMAYTPKQIDAMDVRRLRNDVFVAHHAGSERDPAGKRAPTLEEMGTSKRMLTREAKRSRSQLIDQWNVAYYAAINSVPATFPPRARAASRAAPGQRTAPGVE